MNRAPTKEQAFLKRWEAERAAYLAWGQHVSDRITDALRKSIAPLDTDHFLKTAVKPRLKADKKLIEKAFFRNKNYRDPYESIEDKVGTRFVVLLGSDVDKVVAAVEAMKGWTHSKDRDYDEEQNKNPVLFEYAAVHFVVRPVEALTIGDVQIPAGTPCELQIKTILQHAYSELTHDTIYKPQIQATPSMRRNAAKSMALLEATNDYFEKVDIQVKEALAAVREITANLSAVYRDTVGLEPSPTVLEGLLLGSYEEKAQNNYAEKLRRLLAEKPFLVTKIREGIAQRNPIFSQPSVLLAYLDISERGGRAVESWPLTPSEMEPLLNHLGESSN
ncbi:GTP pyrophosphokinase [Methylobacterium sp. Leaf118]|uniref:GTP pyrophosphokinase n=1 Tax=Methylobacterium sp. Leaf118 TaxID=2876562 RepID=UPI001E519C58|nr:RelA/SpoT family protein [Methylobacterium sp. Leaf118]